MGLFLKRFLRDRCTTALGGVTPNPTKMQNSLFILFILALLKASSATKHYSEGDTLDIYANIVGPYGNPSETYQYYTLPLCAPRTKKKEKLLNLGEVLAGHRLIQGPYDLKFKVPVESATLCSRYMSAGDIDQFRDAIIRDYYFQLMLDGDLPVWGFLGKMKRATAEIMSNATDADAGTDADTRQGSDASSLQSPHRLLLFTHLHFHLLWNGDRVIQCDLSTTSESAVDITNGDPRTIEFTYSVSWNSTSIPFSKRKERYERYIFLPEHVELHWFSIANSVATVLVLTGVLLLIFVRVLRADVARYIDIENADAKDVGWKALHGDVFRPPAGKSILSAAVGVGLQVLLIVTMILCLGIAGHNRPYRGALLASMVILYVLTSGIAGYTSGRTYRALNGDRWVGNCFTVNFLICGPLLIVFSILNTIAWAYGVSFIVCACVHVRVFECEATVFLFSFFSFFKNSKEILNPTYSNIFKCSPPQHYLLEL